MSFSVMFRFSATLSLVKKRQTTVAITFLARIKRSPVYRNQNRSQTKRRRFFAFQDYSSPHSACEHGLPILLFSPRNRLARLKIAMRKLKVQSVSSRQRKKEFAFRSFFS